MNHTPMNIKPLKSVIILTSCTFFNQAINAQINIRNAKKSVPYRSNYQATTMGISAYHSFEIRNGRLWGAGRNDLSQLGDGTTTKRLKAVQIGTDTNWFCVAAGWSHTLGIKADGTLWGWGYNNNSSVLGIGNFSSPKTPKQVGTDTKWIAVATYLSNSFGIKSDGTLWAWGKNEFGELGIGSKTLQYSPVMVGSDNKWVAVTTGINHSIALKSDGTIWAWGENYYNQLGDGTTTSRTTPVQIGSDNDWVSISSGVYHNMALKSDGTLWTWGRNDVGQLGDSTTTDRSKPIKIGSDSDWSFISAGRYFCMALKSNGTLWGWGMNTTYQLGYGSSSNKYHYPQPINGENDWVSVTSGSDGCMALKSDGTIWGWGRNTDGVLGDSSTDSKNKPVKLRNTDYILDISAGKFHSLILRSNGTILASGDNTYGQLGDGTTNQKQVFSQIDNSNDWIGISAAVSHSLGLRSNGTLWAWGNNIYGQLGDGTNKDRLSPVQVGSDSDWVSISAASNRSFALKSNGSIWAWGENNNGALGDGTTTHRTSPVRIGTERKWVSIEAGDLHTFGLKSDGTAWAWGDDTYGQLGIGNYVGRKSPGKIGNDNKWISISAGVGHSLGLKSDGTIWSWGLNSLGQLGLQNNTNYSYPQKIGSGNNWLFINAAGMHSLGIKSDGSLFGWGYNYYGQLFNGSTKDTSLPVQTSLIKNYTKISGGGYHSFALSQDQYLYISGNNCYGQLGDTSINFCYAPKAPLSGNLNICAGNKATLNARGAGKIGWYSSAKGGSYLGGGPIFLTPSLYSTTKYYVQDSINEPSKSRTEVAVTVKYPPKISINASDTIICEGKSIILKGTGAVYYEWSDSIIDGISFKPKSTILYRVTGLDSFGCSDSAKIKITVNTIPKVEIVASDSIICAGNNMMLKGTGANFYNWSGGVIDGVSFIPLASNIYKVEGTDQNGCRDTAQIKIVVKPLPNIQLINKFEHCCDYGNINLSSISYGKPVGGKWYCNQNPSIITSNIFLTHAACNPKKASVFTLTYKYMDPINLCSNEDSTYLTVNPLPKVIAIASDSLICEGTPLKLTANGAVLYNWNKGVTNGKVFFPKMTDTYIVTGKDSANCISADTIQVIVNPYPDAGINVSGTNISANQNGAIYQWLDCNKGYEPISGAVNQTYIATKNGDYAVSIILNDCSDTSVCTNINTIGSSKIVKKLISIYPNPSSGSLIIFSDEDGYYTIINEKGQLLQTFELNSTNKFNVSLENIPKGIYYIKGFKGNTQIIEKIVVIK